MKTRLEEYYNKSIHPAMVDKFKYKNGYKNLNTFYAKILTLKSMRTD